jgi:O-acetyl-ADP-ribose deacetylase (regulator of RNase III)/NAD-dependent SIR2 family protein deacetylase
MTPGKMNMSQPLQLAEYAGEINLFVPQDLHRSSGADAENSLDEALAYLYRESGRPTPHGCQHHSSSATHWLDHLEIFQKLALFRQLLTVRPSSPAVPCEISHHIDTVLSYLSRRRALTSVCDIPSVPGHDKIAIWKGDITTLSGVTAIVNAANSRLLGCFRPDHPCIDNAIHAVAGPQLRKDCEKIIEFQGYEEPTGEVKVTRGYFLPAKFVLHTVGPIVEDGVPGELQRGQLERCYWRCLEAVEELPAGEEGVSVAFCCISTGMFGYPAEQAVDVAIETVEGYLQRNPGTRVSKVIFNVFTEKDLALYSARLSPTSPLAQPSPPLPPSVETAASLISSADALLITAGAGLSASYGLDYTSRPLFSEHFPGMTSLGLTCLYDVFGHHFLNDLEKWGYYFSHMSLVFSWPVHEASVYIDLSSLTARFGEDWFVRTSNADGLFARHGFADEKISTPQGDYRFLQCVANCRHDSVFPTTPFLDKALPHLDTRLQQLHSEEGVPKCPRCGGDMFICVRADNSFNDYPFRAGNARYRKFLQRVREERKRLVILEVGAGWNTPGVLRWPDEELVEDGVAVGLVRIGFKGAEEVPWGWTGDGEGGNVKGVAIGVDAGLVMKAILDRV